MPNVIAHSGSPNNPIWVVVDRPFPRDAEKGTVFSAPYGWVFQKMWEEAGMGAYQPFIMSLRPDLDTPGDEVTAIRNFQSLVDVYHPPFILPMGKTATAMLCPV